MTVECFPHDQAAFEELGFSFEDTLPNGMIQMFDEEANYAHNGYIDAPSFIKNKVFRGDHGAGGGYEAQSFVCDGNTIVFGNIDGPMARIHSDGSVDPDGLRAALEYHRVMDCFNALAKASETANAEGAIMMAA
jgi:hypothetical protein